MYALFSFQSREWHRHRQCLCVIPTPTSTFLCMTIYFTKNNYVHVMSDHLSYKWACSEYMPICTYIVFEAGFVNSCGHQYSIYLMWTQTLWTGSKIAHSLVGATLTSGQFQKLNFPITSIIGENHRTGVRSGPLQLTRNSNASSFIQLIIFLLMFLSGVKWVTGFHRGRRAKCGSLVMPGILPSSSEGTSSLCSKMMMCP